MKVTSCHASAENSEPDCATPIATISPNAVPAATPSAGSNAPKAKGAVKLVCIASELRPRNSPAKISAAIAETLAVVKMFCTILPYSSPRELVHVRSAITARPPVGR